MRKLFAFILILALLCVGLSVYASRTFTGSQYYKALNTVSEKIFNQEITPSLVKNALTAGVSVTIPLTNEKVSLSVQDILNGKVDIPVYGNLSLSRLMGRSLNAFEMIWVQVIIIAYAYSHELLLYGGIAAGVMLVLLIGTHRPKKRHSNW